MSVDGTQGIEHYEVGTKEEVVSLLKNLTYQLITGRVRFDRALPRLLRTHIDGKLISIIECVRSARWAHELYVRDGDNESSPILIAAYFCQIKDPDNYWHEPYWLLNWIFKFATTGLPNEDADRVRERLKRERKVRDLIEALACERQIPSDIANDQIKTAKEAISDAMYYVEGAYPHLHNAAHTIMSKRMVKSAPREEREVVLHNIQDALRMLDKAKDFLLSGYPKPAPHDPGTPDHSPAHSGGGGYSGSKTRYEMT